MKKRFVFFLIILVGLAGVGWLFYDITIPTFVCREVNQSPIGVFGPHGVAESATPGIVKEKFRYRVNIFNISLDWREYKKKYGHEDYVHAYSSGGVTVLTNDPSRIWKFFGGDERKWVRIIWPSSK